jgi:hypothetical protein
VIAGSRTRPLLAALLICLPLTAITTGCSFTENNGNCNAQGGNNSVNCTGPGNGVASPVAPGTSSASAAVTSAPAQGYMPSATSVPVPSLPATRSVSITGEWTVTYATPATVTITLADGTYTETAKTRVLVPNSSCYLPPGTMLSTFTQTGQGTYAGQQNTWRSDCSFDYLTSMTLTLSSDRNTLIAHFAQAIPSTVVFTRIQGTHD